MAYRWAWNKIWVDNKLDVILCPGAANTAVLHDNYGVPPYTAVWNMLEVCSCPGRVFSRTPLMIHSTRALSCLLAKLTVASIPKIW
jgi:hypothetical protein